ncbi:MAG TPA: SAM-dependent methyltransferase [Candidatus Omnitrophota bacterium]|nr:SAM-dependent methyltransferase [Candidatus Omnitrophota bacterium]
MTELTGYLAAEGFEADLRAELGDVVEEHGRLMLAPGPERPAAWAQNVWRDPVRIPIQSIGDGAKALRAIQRNWWPYAPGLHRRTKLMVEKLPKVSAKPQVFGQPAPTAPLGSFTLLDEYTLLASADCSSPFPNGEVHFVEDKATPPNRAYLKLWETFTRLGVHPGPGELCLDLGACPGGWTWVLASLGARVISIDKAPLDPKIAAMPGVSIRQESAFGLEPASVGQVDWLFSDVICYPERLLRLVERWRAAGLARNFVCTVKFQAETDFATLAAFTAIPGSRAFHLFHNKHELTWVLLDGGK